MTNTKISAFINEPHLCANLAKICNNNSYSIHFPKSIDDLNSSNYVLIDLDDISLNPYKISNDIKKSIVVFGLVNRLNKTIQSNANKSGIDLVFPKSLFCPNLVSIIDQIECNRKK